VNATVRRTIAAFEIVGGVAGPAIVVTELARIGFPPDATRLGAVLIAIYLLSLFAGVTLWLDRRCGYSASALVQLVQALKFAGPSFALMLSFGFDVALIHWTHPGPPSVSVVSLNGRVGAHHALWLDPPTGSPVGVGFSLVSVVALWFLAKGRARATPEREEPPAPEPAEGALPRYPG
jgi:hypothetical protein